MSYGDLKKTKGRYDGSCQEVESRRKKTESSFDHGKHKAQSAYQQQMMEMHNVKVWHEPDHNISDDAICLHTDLEHLSHQHQRYKPAEREILP